MSVAISGCSASAWQGIAAGLRLVAVTAQLVGLIYELSSHDAHRHDADCGCDHELRDGRSVYRYEGRWEFYDASKDTWYAYRE